MKFVAVLNDKLALPTLTNALAHICLGLCRSDQDTIELRQFFDASGQFVSEVSDCPFIVLTARNVNHMREFHSELRQKGIAHNIFVEEMIHGSPADQASIIKQTPADALNYVGIAAFGDDAELKPLTKRFSLFKATKTED